MLPLLLDQLRHLEDEIMVKNINAEMIIKLINIATGICQVIIRL